MKQTIETRRMGLLALGVLALTGTLQAQLPHTTLSTVWPPGAKVGATVELTVTGGDLDDARRMIFSHAAITAEPLKDANKFKVTVPAGVPPGYYDVWVAGRYGASNPRSFHVATATEVLEAGKNNSCETAQTVAAGSVISGQADKETSDYYKVELKKGQRLLVECLERELDSRMAGSVVLLGGDGAELARGRLRGFADHTAAADGPVFIQVNDFIYRGGAEYYYRLVVTTGPYVDYVLPVSAQPGTKAKFTLHGRNLPGGKPVKDATVGNRPLESVEVEIAVPNEVGKLPAGWAIEDYQATLDGFTWAVNSPQGRSNARLIGYAKAPVVREAAGNDSADKAQAVTLPCEISGQFFPARDRDWYAFEAKKGEVFTVDVLSHRLGLSTDPIMVVQKANKSADGKLEFKEVAAYTEAPKDFGGDEFTTFHHDPLGRLEIKEDGSYRVLVYDNFNNVQSDPRRVYRLALRKEAPEFFLVARPVAHLTKKNKKDAYRWNSVLRRGDVAAIELLLFRRGGFAGEVAIEVEGLPEGVSFAPVKIPGSEKTGTLLLLSDEKAKDWVGRIRVTGKAAIEGQTITRTARAASVNWDQPFDNNTSEYPQTRLADYLVLGVISSETAPLALLTDAGKVFEAVVGDKVKIPVQIARRDDFNEALKVKAFGHSALGKMKDVTLPAKADKGEVEINLATEKLPEGEHLLYLMTSSKGKYRQMAVEIAAAEAEAKKLETAAAAAEKEAKSLGEAAQKKDLTADQKAAADKAAAGAAAKAKELVAQRDQAKKAAKALADKYKVKDVTAEFYSTPFRLKVNPKPVAKK